VLILQRRGDPVATPECWQLAADLAAFYSDARTERKADVTVAEPKHVQKPRGAPLGAVKLREEAQVLTGYPENVPEDLKEQRIQSGLSDEYRASDKAKL
jgi:predicted ribosome quality control (RQC) complex YloA/Tae2 family protein